MIRFLIIRVLLPLLVFLLLRSVLRGIFAGGSPVAQSRKRPTEVPQGGELRKDPVCGTYVSEAASITRRINGQVVHFCSEECRDKYRVAS